MKSFVYLYMYMFAQTNRLTPVLACEDRTLQVLDRSSLLHSIEVDAVPTVLHLHGNDGGETGDEILYGTADGRIGLVRISRLVLFLLLLLILCPLVRVRHEMNVSTHV
jgi:hypothetical protein